MGFNGIRVLMPFIQVPNNGWLTQSLKFRSLQGPKAHATESDPPKACKLSSAPSHCTTFASHVLVHIVLAEAGVIERQWNFRTNLTSVVCVCVSEKKRFICHQCSTCHWFSSHMTTKILDWLRRNANRANLFAYSCCLVVLYNMFKPLEKSVHLWLASPASQKNSTKKPCQGTAKSWGHSVCSAWRS